jgi:5-methylcytosine-specific restriction protein A
MSSGRVQVGTMEFVEQETYIRKEIHSALGGQRQGGISTPALYPFIFIFTGETGQLQGYGFDGWKAKDRFHYTGEGQPARGDMTFTGGNRAIRDHIANDERILLFEILKKRRPGQGNVKFLGELEYVDHRIESRDTNGVRRDVIVFHLRPVD